MHVLRGGRRLLVAVAMAIAPLVTPAPGAGQQPVRVDSLRDEVRILRAQLDTLRAMIRAMAPRAVPAAPEAPGATPAAPAAAAGADTSNALAALRAAAAAAAGTDTTELKAPQSNPNVEFVGRQRNLSVFNPEMSVTGDLFAVVNSDDASSDNFVPREFELAFQSNLDPYSRAKIFASYHNPGAEILPFPEPGPGEGSSTEVEEGYVEWVNLPGGLGLTVGKFRQQFGVLNRWHPHALPGQMLPLPYLAFFGEEGLVQTGASVHWLLPIHGFGTYEAWGQLTRSSDDALFGDSHRLSVLGHFNAFFPLSRASYFELGLSAVGGSHRGALPEEDYGTTVYGLNFSFDWRPPNRALYRELTVRGGALADRRSLDAGATDAWGGFVIGEYKLGQQWIGGARYEYTQDPADPDRHARLFAPTLTWWQSEFVRVRAEYDFLDRPGGRLNQFLIQTTFAMGPHKHETY